ncbi:MAG: exodeoxyribonuclease V subunit alpha [Lautropia sp.]|nr:exodeoxyribonuclease V subunit alpha [Lautropia sp.]
MDSSAALASKPALDFLADSTEMLRLLHQWHQAGLLRGVDLALARFLAEQLDRLNGQAETTGQDRRAAVPCTPDPKALMLLGAALCSWQLGHGGHACLDLVALLKHPLSVLGMPSSGALVAGAEVARRQAGANPQTEDPIAWLDARHGWPDELLALCSFDDWVWAAQQLPALVSVRSEGGLSTQVASGEGAHERGLLPPRGADESRSDMTPLVLSGPRLYLRRYWQYEQAVSAAILSRLDSALFKLTEGPDPKPADESVEALHQGSSKGPDEGLGQEPLMATRQGEGRAAQHEAPERLLKQVLDALFESGKASPQAKTQAKRAETAPSLDWQKVACALVARQRFGLITGGPGTGKTTTVVRLLALLQSLARQGPAQRFLRIGLAAPTGKAAARLNSSIQGAIDRLPLDGLPEAEAIRAAIPTKVSTLHRLLGSRPDSRHFRHDDKNPLPLDVLVVDEASMVDLEMMAALVKALLPAARLILLGDKDQLASVEAGAILGDLCARAQAGHYWPRTADWMRKKTGQVLGGALVDEAGWPLDQAIAMLRHSHRFSADSGIGALASAVNAGDAASVKALWREADDRGMRSDIARIRVTDADRRQLRELLIWGRGEETARTRGTGRGGPSLAQGYAHYLTVMHESRPVDDRDQDRADVAPASGHGRVESKPGVLGPRWDAWAREVLKAHTRFQLLCAVRHGAWGVEALNRQIAHWLHQAGLLPASEGWYPGRPVMVDANDYELNLMNGDVGICLQTPLGLRVAFEDTGSPVEGGIRWVLPSRLQTVETVFAMTVHKSQGSEFDHAALALPETASAVLTRELVYTAITRARSFFSLCGPHTLSRRFEEAIGRRVHRASGLMAALAPSSSPAI